jgi:3-oxoacyl-[acyl-carrier protein] reductase
MNSSSTTAWSGIADRIALVTGASRGIGAAIADALAAQGAHVIGTATSADSAAAIGERLQQAGGRGRGAVLDVTDPDSVQALMDDLAANEGHPQILINNAGVTRDNLLMRMRDEEWETVLATNLTSVFRLSKACLRSMMKGRYGRIVNIASIVGLTGNPGQANYAASKAGIFGFTKSLAAEVASRGITVNTIAPGFIETDMTRALEEKQVDALRARIPAGRLGSTDDIAAATLFLVSDYASYITGETLNVNGGMYMP